MLLLFLLTRGILSSLHIPTALTTSPITLHHKSLIIPIQQTLTSIPIPCASDANDGRVLVPGMNPRKLINAGHANARNRPEKTTSNKLSTRNWPEKIMSNKLKLCMKNNQVLKNHTINLAVSLHAQVTMPILYTAGAKVTTRQTFLQSKPISSLLHECMYSLITSNMALQLIPQY